MSYKREYDVVGSKAICVDCVYNMIDTDGEFMCDLARREGLEIPNEAKVTIGPIDMRCFSFSHCFLSLDDLLFGKLMEETEFEYEYL